VAKCVKKTNIILRCKALVYAVGAIFYFSAKGNLKAAISQIVKYIGLSILCLSCYCRQSVVCKVQVAVGNGSVVFVLS